MNYFPDRVSMVKSLPAGSVGVEVGVQRGEFSKEILIQTEVSHLYLVDPWVHFKEGYGGDPANISQEGHDENFRIVCDTFGSDGRVSIWRMASVAAAKIMSGDDVKKPDFVYIDANHSYESVLEDLRAWSKAVKPDGWIMGHDFIDNGWCRQAGFGVIQAVEDFCLESDWQLVGLTTCNWSSFMLRKQK